MSNTPIGVDRVTYIIFTYFIVIAFMNRYSDASRKTVYSGVQGFVDK